MVQQRGRRGEDWINQRIREGRGQGEGVDYKPWLYVQEVSSRGLSSRILGWKTGRVHHLLSKLERSFFCIQESSDEVVDIREQYPLLPRWATIEFAQAAGIQHPRYPYNKHGGEPIVMTTDMVITRKVMTPSGPNIKQSAHAVKPSRELESRRVQEKLELERLLCQWQGFEWRLVTENDIPMQLADNVWFLHPYRDIDRRLSLSAVQLYDVASRLTDLVRRGTYSLRHAAAECDRLVYLPGGTALAVAYHLLATRQWRVDLHRRLRPGEVLSLLGVDLAQPSRGLRES